MTRIAAARAPAPDNDSNPRAVIGANRPPIDQLARSDFDEAIDGHTGLRDRIRSLVDSSTRAIANDDETAGRCAELTRQMGAALKVVDRERAAIKAPYRAGAQAVDDAAKALVSELVDADAKVRNLTNSYLRDKQRREDAERARLAAEAAERQRQEAERAAAENRAPEPVAAPPPPPAEPARVRSDFGAVASARKVKVATITDWPKAFKAVKNVAAVQDAVQKAINALVRAGQTDIAGVTITDDVGLSVR